MNDTLPNVMLRAHADCWGKVAAAPPTAAVHRTMGIAQKKKQKKTGKCLCEVRRGARRRQREDKRRSAADTASSAGTAAAQQRKSRNTRNKRAEDGRGSAPVCMRAAAALRQ
jgi:hypothetical protein